MGKLIRYLAIGSILICLLFYINTYLFKYLSRDLFYLAGLFIPVLLEMFVIGYFIYAMFNKKELEKSLLLITFFSNLVTLLDRKSVV